MSKASERRAMGQTLAAYSLVGVPVAARFLDCSETQVRKLAAAGILPGVPVGGTTKFDPLDLAVHVLAGREGVSREVYWERHGDATPENARRYVTRIRKLLGDEAA